MTPTLIALLAAALLAALDVALPIPSGTTPGWRRLLRAAPAGVLAIASRTADGPALLGLSLFLLAIGETADVHRALELGGPELAVRCVGLLGVASLLAELGGGARLPTAAVAAAFLAAAGAALVLRRPALRSGPAGVLAPLPVLAAAATGAAAATLPPHLGWSAAGGALLALATGVELAFRDGPVSRPERALRSAAALALAWPLLRPV